MALAIARLPCPPEHWARFSALLDTALAMDAAARPGWLGTLPASDLPVRPFLDEALAAARGAAAADFLSGPALPPGLDPDTDEYDRAGDEIGPYRLQALLGAGGMAQVWRAVRTDAEGPDRAIALKLPYPEMLGGTFRARFRQERDVLAGLVHPNIATLYDAGADADGRPFLALELVEGVAATDWCRANQATLDRRVELICQVLAALHYAHTRLIVHRDIKPSNVLVRADGVAKLLDFGIARLLQAEGADEGLTQPLARLATRGYAAPEQYDGAAVTVATDLFSAGVLLFELCTGRLPWPEPGFAEPAPRASDAAGGELAPGEVRRLRGDLDAIIARALQADPSRRYGSAEAFGDDLQRWRRRLPVTARRIGRATLAARFVRRHATASILAASLLVAIVGGSLGIVWQARGADEAARRATAISGFLIDLFMKAGPHTGGSVTMTARQLLDAGAARADSAFRGDPVTEIVLLGTLGDIYDALDDATRAQAMWLRRYVLARDSYGASDPRTLRAGLQLAGSQVEFMREDQALAVLAELREAAFAHGPDSSGRAQWLVGHARALRITPGSRRLAIAESQEAIAIFARHHDDDNRAQALQTLSGYQYDDGDYAGSLASLQAGHAIKVAAGTANAMDLLQYDNAAATDLERLGRLDEAEALYSQGEAQAVRQLGARNLWAVHIAISRAQMAHLHGDRAAADAAFAAIAGRAADGRIAATGQDANFNRAYGTALAREGRPAEALPLLRQAMAETLRHPRDEPNLRRTQLALGDTLDQLGQAGEARTLLAAARDGWIADGGGGTQALAARERWARFLLDHGDIPAAAAEYDAVLAAPQPSAPAALALAGRARIALSRGDTAAAQQLADQAASLLALTSAEHDARIRVDIDLVRIACRNAAGQFAAAQEIARQALAVAVAMDAPGSRRLSQLQVAVGSRASIALP
jgi:serine/threonine-protein kinase